jgi:hypothetical protein
LKAAPCPRRPVIHLVVREKFRPGDLRVAAASQVVRARPS